MKNNNNTNTNNFLQYSEKLLNQKKKLDIPTATFFLHDHKRTCTKSTQNRYTWLTRKELLKALKTFKDEKLKITGNSFVCLFPFHICFFPSFLLFNEIELTIFKSIQFLQPKKRYHIKNRFQSHHNNENFLFMTLERTFS